MATDIVMPQLGESIAEGTIVKWLVSKDGAVQRDQPLLEVETDKVALEVPSPTSGVLSEILVKEGETVPIGTVLGRIEEQERAEGVVNRVGGVVVRHPDGEEHFSPAVRHLAQEHGVDLSKVVGTGAGNRVTKKDVLDFVARRQAGAARQVGAQPAAPATAAQATGTDQLLPFTPMRKTIAERMVASRHTSAHVATFFEVDCSEISRFREGRSLTYMPFVVHAVTRAIKDVPIVNASWTDHGILIKKQIHMGVAVAVEEGLLVPVIRDADRKGLVQLGREVQDVAERARTKRLNPEEVQGGTFTITNHGGFGSLFSTPIINQPQVAILGVGAVQKRVVVVNDAIVIRPMCYLSLSFDHRVLDGATADQFMGKVKGYLEHSEWETYL